MHGTASSDQYVCKKYLLLILMLHFNDPVASIPKERERERFYMLLPDSKSDHIETVHSKFMFFRPRRSADHLANLQISLQGIVQQELTS